MHDYSDVSAIEFSEIYSQVPLYKIAASDSSKTFLPKTDLTCQPNTILSSTWACSITKISCIAYFGWVDLGGFGEMRENSFPYFIICFPLTNGSPCTCTESKKRKDHQCYASSPSTSCHTSHLDCCSAPFHPLQPHHELVHFCPPLHTGTLWPLQWQSGTMKHTLEPGYRIGPIYLLGVWFFLNLQA